MATVIREDPSERVRVRALVRFMYGLSWRDPGHTLHVERQHLPMLRRRGHVELAPLPPAPAPLPAPAAEPEAPAPKKRKRARARRATSSEE